jgi:hypothetical protein
LKDYLAISDQFRSGAKSKLLLLGLRPPRNAVGASIVARWIKMVLSDAGVDTAVYSSHSTRGASSSKTANLGVPIEAILLAGCWNSESTFTRFYRRPTSGGSLACVLHEDR